jgi:hypothetical protein
MLKLSKKGVVPIPLMIAGLGVVAVLVILSSAGFRDKLLSQLYSRPSSYAASDPIPPSPTPTPILQLSGQVTDSSNGNVIASATINVTIAGAKGKSARVGSVVTDSNGYYAIILDPKTYNIEASASNYSKQTNTVNFTSPTILDFQLTSSVKGKGRK